jgi:hypothetical protein
VETLRGIQEKQHKSRSFLVRIYDQILTFVAMGMQSIGCLIWLNLILAGKSELLYRTLYVLHVNPLYGYNNLSFHRISYNITYVSTGYGLYDRDSIPCRERRLYSTSSRPALGTTQPPMQWVPEDLSPGLKQPRREANPSTPSSGEVKNSRAMQLSTGEN